MTHAESTAAAPLPTTIAVGGNPAAQPPFDNFDQACRAVLARLRADTGLAMWAFTRTDGNDWLLLSMDGDHAGFRPGTRLPWRDSLCVHMSAGKAPQVAPDVLAEPLYRDAP